MNPRHLKASFLSSLALLAVLFASSCASSERMNRLGYDSDSYSAPKASRISGGRFDEAVVNLRAPADLKDRQVNIWPFCTVNSRYVSILWPFIDWDDFGMAVRPFFNQEGNDCSILFPLSSWNTVDGDGWALNAYWNENHFGIFPLFHYGKAHDSFWYAGPFLGGEHTFGILPLCLFGEYLNIVGPVWWEKNTPGDAREYGFFPLFWKYKGGSTFLPLYYYDRDDCFLSPLFWMFMTPDGKGNEIWGKGQYLILGYWDENGIEHGFVPFYRVDKEDEDLNHVLLWWWKNNTQTCGLFPFAWFNKDGGSILPFASWEKRSATGMNGEEETWTEGNVLLLGYWGRHTYGLFPFFRGSSSDADMKYVGPLWWAYDENEREYGFFPFFRVERSKGEANRSYLFPVYTWEKDRYGSEFTSIPFSREDYDYPDYRATTSVHGRRYLIYATHEKKGNRFSGPAERDDYLPVWDFSPSFLADVKARMKEDDLTEEEADRAMRDEVASKWETGTTALHPFFEWTTSNEGERDLRLLFYLFGFDRDKDSSSNWLLWHILFTSGSDRSRDGYGFERTSGYTNILGVFPYWFRNSGNAASDGPDLFGPARAFIDESIELLLKRALMEDGSEESAQWSENVRIGYIGKRYMKDPDAPETGAEVYRMYTPEELQKQADGPFSPVPGREIQPVKTIKPFKLRQIVPGIPNEEIFRVCGMDRALSGEMTAQEAEDTAKHLMGAILETYRRDGTDVRTNYGFFPLFDVDRTEREKDGETKTVSTEVITPLTYTSVEEDESITRILLGILGYHEDKTYYRFLNGHARTDNTFSTLGLIRSETEVSPHMRKGYYDIFDDLVKLVRTPDPGANPVLAGFRNLLITAACDELLKEYSIEHILPFRDCIRRYRDGARTEADGQALIDELTRLENEYIWRYDVRKNSSGFYPFFFWETSRAERNSEVLGSANSWFILPLLSGGSSNPEGSSLGILCPLLYYGATKTPQVFDDPGFRSNYLPSGVDAALPDPEKILPADANVLKSSHGADPVRGRSDHYALFLVGTSDEKFAQWKPGTDPLVQDLYARLTSISRDFYKSNAVTAYYGGTLTPAEIAAEAEKAAAMDGSKTAGEFERIFCSDLLDKEYSRITDAMEKLGMKPFDRDTPLKDSFETLRRSIAAEHIQMRTVSGFNTGWSLLSSSFSCEETGDYQTNVLFGLGANSQKLGAKEHRSILGYLYNMDTDGINTRKFIFPFITTKDAPGFHEWSFLGGLFERSEEDGKTGGRIFFFPYGNRPGKD